MAATRDDECQVLRDVNVTKRAANKCARLLRHAVFSTFLRKTLANPVWKKGADP